MPVNLRPSRNDEADLLRAHLQRLVLEICSTVAHPVRPQSLNEAIALSQQALRRGRTRAT